MKLLDFHLIFFSDSSEEDHLSDNFVVCTSSADCYPISPSILISILGGLGENLSTSASENDVNIDIPQRRGISGSYLFRSKKADGEKEKKSNRRGGYLFRTKKMGRYTRGKLLSFLYPHYIQGTIPILRQKGDWVGGVRKMAIFADVQYYSCWRRVGGWVKKSSKMCWRNIGTVPNTFWRSIQIFYTTVVFSQDLHKPIVKSWG